MDKFFLQLAELNRAGWSFQIAPEPNGATMPAVRAAILWSFQRDGSEPYLDGAPPFPLIDWMNLFAPEIELRKAVAKMHARVFPFPPYGDLPAPAD